MDAGVQIVPRRPDGKDPVYAGMGDFLPGVCVHKGGSCLSLGRALLQDGVHVTLGPHHHLLQAVDNNRPLKQSGRKGFK